LLKSGGNFPHSNKKKIFKKPLDKTQLILYNKATKKETTNHNKQKEGKKIMIYVMISKNWFNDIKDKVKYSDPYYFIEKPFGEQVEVQVEEQAFETVSKELGWI
jgi:t-SNARE complex subunit (syntaxin)